MMSGTGFAEDMRLSFVVMKNEVKKFASSRKLIMFGLLMAFLMVLITAVVFVYGDRIFGPQTKVDKVMVGAIYIAVVELIIVLGGVLFSATSIVSEFEERTALILFTKPIRKRSIFIGKFFASMIITMAFVLVYYAISIVVSIVYAGDIVAGIPQSFLAALCFVFAMTGLSFLMSSLFKKGSTASIMTLVMYLLVLTTIASLLMTFHIIDNWWVLTKASMAITAALGGTYDIATDVFVLLVWGVATSILAYVIFKRRDF